MPVDSQAKDALDFQPIIRLLRIVLGILAAWTILAVGAHIVNSRQKEANPALNQADIIPLLNAVQSAWTAIPSNQEASIPQVRFDRLRKDLDLVLAHVDWKAGVTKDQAKDLQAIASELQETSGNLLAQRNKEDAALVSASAAVQREARSLLDRAKRDPGPTLTREFLVSYSEAMSALGGALAAWPVVTIAGVMLALFYASRMGGIAQLFGGVQSIKIAGGNEIIFSPAEAPERSKTANDVFASYREKATAEFAAMAKDESIDTRLKNVCVSGIRPLLAENVEKFLVQEGILSPKQPQEKRDEREMLLLNGKIGDRWNSVRATVHVQDLVFDYMLCQLVEYFPKPQVTAAAPTGVAPTPTAGRPFSIRYGMIGMVWRLQQSYSETAVTRDEVELVTQWGMTRDEVRNFVAKKRSFTTIVFNNDGGPFALLYLDSDIEDVFLLEGTDKKAKTDALHRAIEDSCEKFHLRQSLETIAGKIANRRLAIRISR